jgi:hypothetical protein
MELTFPERRCDRRPPVDPNDRPDPPPEPSQLLDIRRHLPVHVLDMMLHYKWRRMEITASQMVATYICS